MKSSSKLQLKDCFGDQGGSMLGGEPASECLACELFDKCHKVTIAAALQGINSDLGFLIQNGLASGWLKSYMELNEDNGHKQNSKEDTENNN